MMSRVVATVSSACCVVLLSASVAAAQSSVFNGEFNTDVLGWNQLSAVTLTWDPTSDYASNPGSGSALVVNAQPGSANSGATQCVNGIQGGESYDLSAWLLAPTGQSASGHSLVFVWWYSQADCADFLSLGPGTAWLFTSDTWVEHSVQGEPAPPGAASAIVYLNVVKESNTPGSYQVSFDHVLFQVTGTIFIDGFDTGDHSVWSAVAP